MIIVRQPTVDLPDADVPDRPPRIRPQPARYVLVGCDGVEWDLNTGPVRIGPGARGFGLPVPTHWTDIAPAVAGAEWQGMRYEPRDLFIPVRLRGGHGESILMRDLEDAFWAGLDPRQEVEVRVTAPDGVMRRIPARYQEGGEGEYNRDPMLLRHAFYPLRLMANGVFWLGEAVGAEYIHEEAVDFFGTGVGNVLAIISSSHTLDRAPITNPGDEPAWPLWRVEGPFTSFSVGVGPSVVSVTHTALAGEWIEVDMDPRAGTIVDQDGVDRGDDVTDAVFAAIPTGGTELAITVAGAGEGTRALLSFTPQYRRAW